MKNNRRSFLKLTGLTEIGLAGTGIIPSLGFQTRIAVRIGSSASSCDPVGGLVQIPCIERNSMGAIKAITASHLALESNPK